MAMTLFQKLRLVSWWCVSLLLAGTTMVVVADRHCDENSYLWKVHTRPPVYLFGTVHVPYTTLWDYIPENAKTAFSSSEDLCVELRLSDPATLTQLSECTYLPRDQRINQVLSQEMHQRISNYLRRIRILLPNWLEGTSGGTASFFGGRSIDQLFNAMVAGWERKRPIWVLLMLSSITEQNIRLRTIPLLDLFLDNAAAGLGKRVQAMETPNDQCRPLNRLSTEQVELALRVQLDYLEPLAFNSSGPHGTVERDVETYRCGDFVGLVGSQMLLPIPPLDNITNATAKELGILQNMNHYLTNQLVVRRNRKMTRRLHGLLNSTRNVTYFIALGAGHLLGNSNVIDRLRKKGHTVEHIPASKSIEGPSLPSNVVALGHPDSAPRVLKVLPKESGDTLPTIDPKTLSSIWDKYVINAPPAPSWPPILTSLPSTSPTQGMTSASSLSTTEAPTKTSTLSSATQTRLQTRSQMQQQNDLSTRQVIPDGNLIDVSAADSPTLRTPQASRNDHALGAEMSSSSNPGPSGTAVTLMTSTMLSCTFSLLIARLNPLL